MEKPTRLALLKEIAEFLNEETEMYSMMHGGLRYLINGSNFDWMDIFINEEGDHELVSSVDPPWCIIQKDCHYMTNGSCWCVKAYNNKN